MATITLLISAHNEEAVIAARLENALAADYPVERMRIVVASDGSDDGTASVVASFADRGVRLLDYPVRRGKAAALNAGIAEIDTELVLLSDANTEIDPAAPRKLVRWFADANVGAVCGRLVLVDPATAKNADSLYWRYETFLKTCEGKLGGLLGANGAIYAIRRSQYIPIPAETIVDDFVIPLLMTQRSGCRIVYDPEATAREETAIDVGGEFRRRARIGAGGFQAIALLWRLLNPLRGWVAFTFLSHKVLRWLCPFFLIAMLVCSGLDRSNPVSRELFVGQVVFYATAFLVNLIPGRRLSGALRPLRLIPMFIGMNVALLVGFFRWIGGTQKATWGRTQRSAEANATVSERVCDAARNPPACS